MLWLNLSAICFHGSSSASWALLRCLNSEIQARAQKQKQQQHQNRSLSPLWLVVEISSFVQEIGLSGSGIRESISGFSEEVLENYV